MKLRWFITEYQYTTWIPEKDCWEQRPVRDPPKLQQLNELNNRYEDVPTFIKKVPGI